MAKISVFNFISLDGYYKGLDEDIDWHQHGEEEGRYSAESLQANNTLLFGRVTFEMMASFWPTEQAAKSFPEVAKGMSSANKIVFSRTLKKTDWVNTTIVNSNMIAYLRRLKASSEDDMTILGSGSLVTQLSEHRLVDAYSIMIDPVIIGKGVSIMSGISTNLQLKLRATKTFKSGVVLLEYTPDY